MKKITILTLIMLLASSTLITITAKAINISVETSDSCAAGTDNDGDFLTGVADPDCSAFAIISQPIIASETSDSCAAGTDNDGDFLTGVADPDCAAFKATTIPVVTPTPTTGGGGFSGPSFGSGPSGGSSSGITSGTPISTITTGTPVSATSSEPVCPDMFKTYMRKGKVNNTAEVKKLQGLLNKYLGLKIPATGFFGSMTENAVKAFQLKYTDSVLTPWGITAPTGYFFKTTQRQANILLCSAVEIPMPVLK